MREPPEQLEVAAILDASPRYAGTSHDDATARAMGFRAALIPGAFIYGHATRLAVIGWGEDWLARGRARVRFRRPVYNGDPLVIARGELMRDGDGLTAPVTVTNSATGEVVLDGSIGLADAAPSPPTDLPLLAVIEPRLDVTGPGFVEGLALGSAATVLSEALVSQSRDDFHETEPIYRARGLVHSGCLLRKTMGDTFGNLALPMPVIFASTEVQNLAPAPIGRSYRTSARVTRIFEERGRRYFDSEEWLIAEDGRAVARHRRRNLYAMTG